MEHSRALGHALAFGTVAVWGTTFISTKVLLTGFQPVEILFIRFILGLLALFLACPRRIRGTTWRQELLFAGAGLTGVCLYYLLENIALTCTLASNVGVVISVIPFFTAVLAHLVLKEKRPGGRFLLGFAVAMAGISLISFNGARMELNPLGDLLTLLAALMWACYVILTRKLGAEGWPTILVTRRIFFYGLLWMIPALFLFDCRLGLERLANPLYLGNLLFLGLGASALGFVTWNQAVKLLGPVPTSVYTYMTPVVTMTASVLILHERVTSLALLGAGLTMAGLLLSQDWTALKGGAK